MIFACVGYLPEVVHIQNCGEDGKARDAERVARGSRGRRRQPFLVDDAGTGETTASGGQGPELKESSQRLTPSIQPVFILS